MPSIRAAATPGHTPRHMAVEISSQGEQLLCISDAALHPIHLEWPHWYAAVDLNPEQIVTTWRRRFSRAASERALVFALHFPFPGLGHIIHKEDSWE